MSSIHVLDSFARALAGGLTAAGKRRPLLSWQDKGIFRFNRKIPGVRHDPISRFFRSMNAAGQGPQAGPLSPARSIRP